MNVDQGRDHACRVGEMITTWTTWLCCCCVAGVYFMFVMIMCCLELALTILVMNLHNRATSEPLTAMPLWVLSRPYIDCFAKVLGWYIHTYIHNKSYSAQSYIKNRATVHYKSPDIHKRNKVKAMLKRCDFRARRKECVVFHVPLDT